MFSLLMRLLPFLRLFSGKWDLTVVTATVKSSLMLVMGWGIGKLDIVVNKKLLFCLSLKFIIILSLIAVCKQRSSLVAKQEGLNIAR
jgi:hypothetical protein